MKKYMCLSLYCIGFKGLKCLSSSYFLGSCLPRNFMQKVKKYMNTISVLLDVDSQIYSHKLDFAFHLFTDQNIF